MELEGTAHCGPDCCGIYHVYGRWFWGGAPAHRRVVVQNHLHQLFKNDVMAFVVKNENGDKCPDVTSLAFFLFKTECSGFC